MNRQLVHEYLSTDAPAQILRPRPESNSQSGSAAQGSRLQADIIDYSCRKATWNGMSLSYMLVIFDVASMRVCALAIKRRLLNTWDLFCTA